MKCQNLLSVKNKKGINMSSAELVQRVVNIKIVCQQRSSMAYPDPLYNVLFR